MGLIDNTAFLFGFFIATKDGALPKGWSRQVMEEKDVRMLKNFYIPSFVDFSVRDISRYVLPVGKEVSVPLRNDGDVPVRVTEIRLYRMPFNMVISAVRLDICQQEAAAVFEALSSLRYCCFYNPDRFRDFISCASDPVIAVYSAFGGTRTPIAGDGTCDYSFLVENGNKFRIFQIITGEGVPTEAADADRFLFGAGTLSVYDPDSPRSSSPDFFRRTLAEHKLSVFGSWNALALLDTCTFTARELASHMKEMWTDDYMGLIYVYELFRKYFLYHLNARFREGEEQPADLQKQLVFYERKYTFPSVSYNFLPLEIDAAIQKSLDVGQEEKNVYHMISQEMAAREEAADKSTNRFLLFLTFLATFSAIYDTTALIDEMVSYEDVFHMTATGYRLFASLLLLIILAGALITRRSGRNKR